MYKTQYDSDELTKWRSNCVHFPDVLDPKAKNRLEEKILELANAIKEWYDLSKGMF